MCLGFSSEIRNHIFWFAFHQEGYKNKIDNLNLKLVIIGITSKAWFQVLVPSLLFNLYRPQGGTLDKVGTNNKTDFGLPSRDNEILNRKEILNRIF